MLCLIRYGDAPALRTMLSEELTERAASLHRSASLQRRHSRGSASSDGAPGSPSKSRHSAASNDSSAVHNGHHMATYSAVSAAASGHQLSADGTTAAASNAPHLSVNGASSDATEPGRPATTNQGSSKGGSSSVFSPGNPPGSRRCEETTDAVRTGVGGFPGIHPMSSPFRSAGWSTEPSPQHSMQPNANQHAGGKVTELEVDVPIRAARLAGTGQRCAARKSGSMELKAGNRAQSKHEESEHTGVNGDAGITGFRGDDKGFQGRRNKSDQLAAALRRMSMRADEQLREQAEHILKSSG